jgi:spore coat protein U-like protein
MKKYLLALLASASFASGAAGQTCTASVTTPITFTSVNPLSSNTYDTTATLTLNCTGVPQLVGACPDIGAGTGGLNGSNQRLLKGQSTGATIPFQIFQNDGRTQVWGSQHTPPGGSVPLLNRIGNGSMTATLYLRLYAQNPPYPPGTYTSSFSGADATVYYGLLSALGACSSLLSRLTLTVSDPFAVQSTLNSLCILNVTQNVNFGSAVDLNANIDATGALSVQCTSGTAFQIALGPGNGSGATVSSRKMTRTGGGTTGYALYRDSARSLNWGETAGSDTVSGTGTGSAAAFTVYGRIPPQSLPPTGAYDDSVTVTVTY